MTDLRARLSSSALLCAAALLACTAFPAVAQYEDDTLEDQEQLDRRYLERYRQKEDQPEPPAETDDPARAAAFIAQAEELIRDKNYRSYTTDRFRVQTDDPRVDPKAAATLLERFAGYFDEFWSDTLELQPRLPLSRVFLFYSFHKYNQLLSGDWRFSQVRPKGHYLEGVNAITLHTDSAAASDLADVLVHEETHQLFGERRFTGPHPIPVWVSEGLASYFGYTYMDDDGRFHPGEIGGKRAALMRGGKATGGQEGQQRLAALKKSMKSKTEAPGLSDVTGVKDPAIFYSRPEWSYSASWILVHFLLHGDDGARRDGFARYLMQVTHAECGPEVLFREIGLGAEELDQAASAYLKKLKAR